MTYTATLLTAHSQPGSPLSLASRSVLSVSFLFLGLSSLLSLMKLSYCFLLPRALPMTSLSKYIPQFVSNCLASRLLSSSLHLVLLGSALLKLSRNVVQCIALRRLCNKKYSVVKVAVIHKCDQIRSDRDYTIEGQARPN